jgi:AAA ATPase domain
MNPDDVVAKIDLAPKLKRPLSLWNPLDYLRLLYWVFYFPQALLWYEETFGNDTNYLPTTSFRHRWQWLRQNHIARNLIVQIYIILLMIFFVEAFLRGLNVDFFWLRNLVGFTIGILTGRIIRATSDILLGHSKSFYVDLKLDIGLSLVIGALIGVFFGRMYGTLLGVLVFLIFGIISAFHLESWLLNALFIFFDSHNFHSSHISPITTPSIQKKIFSWLSNEWVAGVQNTNQILKYTYQFAPTARAINLVLATTSSDQLLLKTSLLAQHTCSLYIIKLASASLRDNLIYDFVQDISLLPNYVKKRLTHHLLLDPRIDTPARAAAAGFWYLSRKDPYRAFQAFSELRSLPYGQEMCILAQTLILFEQPISSENSISTIADIPILLIPSQPHLHPESWKIIAGFQQVITDIKIVKTSNSRPNKSLALNRALGQLGKIIKQSNQIVTAEKKLIIKNATNWQSALLTVTSEIGEIVILEPVISPYTIGDPVEGDAFVGRDDIMNQLSELWRQNKSVQSVVLYGHRRMGKTSILRNINNRLGDNVSLAYVNMLLMTNPQGEADILMFICDQIKIATGVNIPTNAEFSAFPETTCRRYIQEVLERMDANEDPLPSPLPRRERGQETTLNDPNPEASRNAPAPLLPTWEKGLGDEGISLSSSEPPSPIAPLPQKISSHKLIIAIDEFEQIDELIAAQKISPSFLSFLRGLVQISPNIAFAFAGLHTLEERVANYSDPFFASFIPIPVGFLSLGATRQLLANPADPDFPLDYTPETLDRIYQLTAGQPYLTQLVGFQLVRHYNNQVFEEGRTRDPMLTLDDLNTVIQDPVFFDRGRYYFTGVWNQSSQDVPHQQTILTALTPHPTGLSLIELSTITNLTLPEINAALKILERHDVAIYEQDKWRISIELFRRWVANKLYAQP